MQGGDLTFQEHEHWEAISQITCHNRYLAKSLQRIGGGIFAKCKDHQGQVGQDSMELKINSEQSNLKNLLKKE